MSGLPPPTHDQPVIKLRRLEAGTINLPTWMFVAGADKSEHIDCPSMSWLLSHPSGKNLVFDLGLPKTTAHFTPEVQRRLREFVKINVDQDVFDSLSKLKVDPKDVDAVIFSHLHYDHIGDPSGFSSPTTRFILGPGSSVLTEGPRTYPSNPDSWYHSDLLPKDRIEILPPATPESTYWHPLGNLPAVHDYFGDRSLYIVNSPGHLEGHLNLLVRIEREKWILLAGDSCHDIRILTGECETSVYPDPLSKIGAKKCAHLDKEAAEEHLGRLRGLANSGVEVVLSHDWKWVEDNKERFK